jgi:hypothetical protein
MIPLQEESIEKEKELLMKTDDIISNEPTILDMEESS